MSLTYERPSAECLNGRWNALSAGGTAPAKTGRYTRDELSLRTGVPRAALRDLPGPLPRGQYDQYAAIDVVRLAVVDRLVRSGVPVARAAALVRAAESRVITGV